MTEPAVYISDDSDAGIPLAEIYVRANLSEDGICWSCQTMLSSSTLPIHLDSDTLLPVCAACWAEIPIADRLSLGIQFKNAEFMRQS